MGYNSHTWRESVSLPASGSSPERHPLPSQPRVIHRLLMLVLGLAFSAFLIWAGSVWWEQEQVLKQMETEIIILEEKVRQAEQHQAELLREKELLHDPEYIAEIARRDYLLSKEGEIIFKVVE